MAVEAQKYIKAGLTKDCRSKLLDFYDTVALAKDHDDIDPPRNRSRVLNVPHFMRHKMSHLPRGVSRYLESVNLQTLSRYYYYYYDL